MVAALPAAAGALTAASAGGSASVNAPATVMLREYVPSAGVFDVRIKVGSDESVPGVVDLRIGSVARREAVIAGGHGVLIQVRVPISGRTLTIRASAARVKPTLSVTLSRISAAPEPKTRASSGGRGGSASAGSSTGPIAAASTSNVGSTGSSGSSGPVGPAGSTGQAGSTGSTGPSGSGGTNGGSGSSGSSGSGGNSGSTGTSGAGSSGPSGPGTSSVTLPQNFAPIASYTNLAKDYEFDGSGLPADWSVGSGSNYGYSSTEYEASQVSMTGSSVALTAAQRTSPSGLPYEGGWISTANAYTFSHGMLDFRAKMPAGQGLWSGLWAVNPAGTTPFTEIDVQEMLLGDTHTVYGSLHNWGPTPYWAETQSADVPTDLSTGFHDYQVIWQPGMLTWAVDGVAYAQYTAAQATATGQAWPFDASNGVYLIADLAVGGANDWGGAPNASTQFPATMQIQSVKVWQ